MFVELWLKQKRYEPWTTTDKKFQESNLELPSESSSVKLSQKISARINTLTLIIVET